MSHRGLLVAQTDAVDGRLRRRLPASTDHRYVLGQGAGPAPGQASLPVRTRAGAVQHRRLAAVGPAPDPGGRT
jgi:hypothetical protein